MRERGKLSYYESSRIPATHAARKRPFAARRRDAERVLDVELERRRATSDCALERGLGEKDIHPALRVREGLPHRAMGAGLLHASDQARAGRHDHAGLD